MKLTLEQINSIAIGAARVEEQDGLVSLFRFTKKQEEAYKNRSADFYNKCFATAGIRLEFETDSPTLALSVLVHKGSSRRFFAHDVYVNDRLIGQLGATLEQSPDPDGALPFFGEFALGEGTKTVRVYFPWSMCSRIREFSLADGATITPVKKRYRMICFGDSITHGYDSEHPSLSYANRIVDALNANAVNKGIGGERFWPDLATMRENFDPDLITVAYGTNDWAHCATREKFVSYTTQFYQNLSALYPNAKIFALTPIWRGDWESEKPTGPFSFAHECIEKATKDLPNTTVIRCFDFVPKHSHAFRDKSLHPNDAGFGFYANGVLKELKKYL